jgi:hypothetical protein
MLRILLKVDLKGGSYVLFLGEIGMSAFSSKDLKKIQKVIA